MLVVRDRLLGDAPEGIRVAAIGAAVSLGLTDAAKDLRALLKDPRNSPLVRSEALGGLETLGDSGLLESALAAAVDSTPEVRIAGQRIVSSLKPEEAIPMLAAALEKGVTLEPQGAFSSLGASRNPAAQKILMRWLEKLLKGDVPAAAQLDLVEAAEKQGTPELKALLARHESSKPPTDPLAKYRECLTGGDAARGNKVFFQKSEVHCQRCHKTDKPGGEVGPDLADLGLRVKREHILESIVAPNAKITEGYTSVTLATKDGRIITGVLRKEDDQSIQMISADGVVLTCEKDDIAERSGGLSAMPEDLIKFLSRGEIRDLVEYLAGLRLEKTKER